MCHHLVLTAFGGLWLPIAVSLESLRLGSVTLWCITIQYATLPYASTLGWGPTLKSYKARILRSFPCIRTVSYTHLRAHETPEHLVCRLLLEKKKKKKQIIQYHIQ
eukprot:TRINITY_DN5655_c0_g1_i6.p1 TRINITY_DN5655_c0_g1~~TRINITY_DN5655_c0_g1_i6.p1  ORF type:complete len:106 (-),score=3.78 TRINITY_DN5655_c0_g1_i6:65-382(-)